MPLPSSHSWFTLIFQGNSFVTAAEMISRYYYYWCFIFFCLFSVAGTLEPVPAPSEREAGYTPDHSITRQTVSVVLQQSAHRLYWWPRYVPSLGFRLISSELWSLVEHVWTQEHGYRDTVGAKQLFGLQLLINLSFCSVSSVRDDEEPAKEKNVPQIWGLFLIKALPIIWFCSLEVARLQPGMWMKHYV